MRLHVVQHVPFEGPGAVEDWAKARGHELIVGLAADGLPSAKDVTALVSMGGPMGVHDPLPFLAAERELLRTLHARKVPVLGICLGAQQLAFALGGRVTRNRVKEIGWFPVEKTADHPLVAGFPAAATVFHWHGDTFEPPSGAVRLLRSDGCENQAFVFGRSVGLQCHLEMRADSVAALVAHCGAELHEEGERIQPLEAIRDPRFVTANRRLLDGLLDAWLAGPPETK